MLISKKEVNLDADDPRTRYCRKQHKKEQLSSDSKWVDPKVALRAAGKRDFTLFLRWCFKLRRGKNGRRLKGIKRLVL